MPAERQTGRVEDYTDAFLATLGLILFMALWCIGALFGFLWVIATALAFDRIRLLIARRRPG
ncbi:hypothetical protein EU805_10340 [Salipiger sp. IMCC34102]|uniref:hypothetical protein n=1 Tax=Salipiger sp. IMCC34102 TaxID=2510647 RepID=UPI00101D194E|nr:hypothetical protein [Salipiger sp. IMCC34102]RYH02241.1 hypothetical protein EU805_10340 [Salipiger sp. IMCC34102]